MAGMKNLSARVMGILNVTPDSFSDGGKFNTVEKAVEHARKMILDGADIIDVGGESTRPGSDPVSLQEEMDRVLPVIEKIRNQFPVTLSVDTTKFEVAAQAVSLGATLINDVSGGRDIRLIKLLTDFPPVSLILMHSKGEPKTMHEDPKYALGVVSEVKEVLQSKIRQFGEAGVEKSRLWLDPGIGFGKTVNHNLDLLRHLDSLNGIGGRVVIGTSRKSFLGSLIGEAQGALEKREPGTLATHLWAFQKGASVFRVHDVGAMKRALISWEAVQYGRF